MFRVAGLIIGTTIFCTGISLLIFGIHSSNSFLEKFIEKFTGRYTEETMAYIIGGIAASIAGISLFIAFSIKSIFPSNIDK